MMTDAKCRQILDLYEARLKVMDRHSWAHVTDRMQRMIPQMREMLDVIANADDIGKQRGPASQRLEVRNQREKFMRWLGFMQGVFWSVGIYTIEELKSHNRPDPESV